MQEKINIALDYMAYIGKSERRYWIRPIEIGRHFKQHQTGFRKYSSFGSAICKQMVEQGLCERNEQGHYKLIPVNDKLRVVERYAQTKDVQAWNATLNIPASHDWIWYNSTGVVWSAFTQPVVDQAGYFVTPFGADKSTKIARVVDFTNWRRSLTFVGETDD
jgi:hypothetical protein